MIEPDAGRASVVLAATDAPVEGLARALLSGAGDTVTIGPDASAIVSTLVAIVTLGTVIGSMNRPRSRVGALTAVVAIVTAGVAFAVLGPWHWALRWSMGVLLGALVGAGSLAIARALDSPWLLQRRPWVPLASLAGAVVALAVVALLLL